jgi:glycosyltransferase involved in cell wall biosynthesis
MKLSLIIPSFYPATVYGGPIFSTLHTCYALAKLDDMEIYVSTTNTNMTSKLDVETNKWKKFEDNFYVKYYDETKVDKFSLQLYLNVWKDIKIADVVHIQGIFNTPIPISLFFARLYKKPILLSPRGSLGAWCLENGSSSKQKWLEWFIKPFAYNIVWHATAEQEKNEIQAIFPNSKVEIISNGIEYDLFQEFSVFQKQEFMTKFAKKEIEVEKIIVSMGRLQKKKGFDILIDSFVIVLEQYPKAKLFIAGQNEDEEDNLLQQIKELGLVDKVFLTGAINGQEKIDFLANADLFVLPSHNENFGNVYVESLAAGTPIVASKNTPWSEVEEADCGKWVDNSVDETTSAILEMLTKDKEKMQVNSRKLAQKYDWKNIALQFKEVFEDIVMKNRKNKSKKEGGK